MGINVTKNDSWFLGESTITNNCPIGTIFAKREGTVPRYDGTSKQSMQLTYKSYFGSQSSIFRAYRVHK